MTSANLAAFYALLIMGVMVLFIAYVIFTDRSDAIWLGIILGVGSLALFYGAFTVYSLPKYGDLRIACVNELKRVTIEEHGVKYSRVDYFCSGKFREEVYVKTKFGGEWTEVVK